MRIFDTEEKEIITKILHGSGYARNLINIIDSLNRLSGVRIHINRSERTAKFLFETKLNESENNEPTDEEYAEGIKRQVALSELIITHVTLLRYLEKEELAVFFEPTKETDNIIEFGMGAEKRIGHPLNITFKVLSSFIINTFMSS